MTDYYNSSSSSNSSSNGGGGGDGGGGSSGGSSTRNLNVIGISDVRSCMAAYSTLELDANNNYSSSIIIEAANFTQDEEESNHRIDYVLHGLVITILVCFGSLGNSAAVFVFTRPRHWPCINYYLVALAIWDVALLASSFLLFALPTLLYGGMPTYGTYVEIYPYFYVFSNLTLVGSEWIVVMLTVERFLAIYRPLQHRTFLNTHTRVKTILIAVSVVAVLYNVPRIFDLQIVTCRDENGALQSTVERTWLYNDWWFRTFYKVVGNLLFVYAGPFLVLSTLTIFICVEIRRATVSNKVVLKLPDTTTSTADSNGNSTTSKKVSLRRTVLVMSKHQSVKDIQCSRQQSNNVNVMSVIVVGKFLICFSLPTISDIFELVMSEDQFNRLGLLVTLGNVFVVLNSSCNFLIYFAFGKTFRHCLLRRLRRCLEKVFKNTQFAFGGSSIEEPNSVTASLVSSQHRRCSNSYNAKRNSYSATEVKNCIINAPINTAPGHQTKINITTGTSKNDFWV